MKFLTLILCTALSYAVAAPAEKLAGFELSDQHARARTYRFPKARVTVMTVADHQGSAQLPAWIERVYRRFGKRVDIDGVADVSMIPGPFQGMLREAFRKQLTYSVMLDWNGSVVDQFAPTKGLANIYVIDRQGRVVKRMTGPVSDAAMRDLSQAITQALADLPPTK